MFLISFIALGAIAIPVVANVLQLVSLESPFKSTAQIRQYMIDNGGMSLKDSRPIISFINCGSSKGEIVVNKILETNAYLANDGICMKISGSAIALCPSYQTMYHSQNKFCGAKAIDYCGSVSSQVCILLPVLDIEESLAGYDQIFRRLFLKAVVQKKKLDLVVLVDNSVGSTSTDVNRAISLINSRIGQITKEILAEFQGLSTDADDVVKLVVETVQADDKESLDRIRQALLRAEGALSVTTTPTNTLSNRLHDAWTEASQSAQKPVLTPAQRQSLLQVEIAYASGLAQTEAMANQWRARVNNGKIIAKFGNRVNELVTGAKKSFYERTTGTLVVRERADRVQQLVSNILSIAKLLFAQQLLILEKEVTDEFKRDLLEILRKKPESYSADQQQVIRDAIYRFKKASAELEGEGLGLSSSDVQAELSTKFQEEAKEFPESNAAKLDGLRRMEKQVKKPRRKKGKRAVNLTLNLVGMLRPPGYGNLQGFVGYNGLSFFGVPVETLFGVQNDGDAPEILGEDREQPILRLQPKVHFDIDL